MSLEQGKISNFQLSTLIIGFILVLRLFLLQARAPGTMPGSQLF
jgi:hypothetical protein